MRAILLLSVLLINQIGFSQVPTDDLKRYLFTNGSLVNNAFPGTSDLIATGSNRSNTDDATGISNNALILNGDEFNAGNRITTSDPSGLNEVSISFWFKSNTNDSLERMILSQYESTGFGFYGWRIFIQNGKIKVTSKSLINGAVVTPELAIQSIPNIDDNNWHHVVCILNKTTFYYSGWTNGPQVALYVDNILMGSNYSGGASSQPLVYLNPNNCNVLIANGANKFTESIDNIRIYNKTLSASEIESLFLELNPSGTYPTIYVDVNATGANNGYSWTNAFTSLQAALSVGANREIWVKSGIYIPHASDRNASFTINASNVKIYGGFAGTETQLSDRVFGTNETILSGDLLGNDDNNLTYVNTTRDDNSFTVLNLIGDNIELDGLTISDGHANGTSGSATEARYGGGIHKSVNSRNLTINNCKVIRNVSKEAGGAISAGFGATGGASSLTINGSNFSENLSAIGGAIYSASIGTSTVSYSISNSLFSKNRANDTSGVATGYAGSSMWLRAYNNSSTMITNITNCTFVDNIDEGTASGMSNTNRTTLALTKNTSANHTATITNCIFWNNKAATNTVARPIGGFIENIIPLATVKNSIDETSFTGITFSASSTNNSSSDPMFTDLPNSDYTLGIGSPAIDTGDNSSVVGTLDLLGLERVYNTIVDMGAYEYGSILLDSYNFNLKKDFSVYPNPTTSIVNINYESDIEKVEIYSSLGNLIQSTKNKILDIAHLQNGLYFVIVYDNDGKVNTKKILKK